MSSAAASVWANKERHPENYCADKRCLWRVATRDGLKPCPKHPVTPAAPKAEPNASTEN